jgi:hypothetical protein
VCTSFETWWVFARSSPTVTKKVVSIFDAFSLRRFVALRLFERDVRLHLHRSGNSSINPVVALTVE